METSFAITGKGYVIVAADTTSARSIVKMKTDDDKIKTLSQHLLMAYSGEPGQSSLFIVLPLLRSHYTRRHDPVCGVCRTQHPTLPYPQPLRSDPSSRSVLDSSRRGGLTEESKALLGQYATRRIRYDYIDAASLLDRLPRHVS